MFTSNVSHTPPAMSAARQILTAGQARAKRILAKIEAQCSGSAILEVGALRAMVRNLCAEVAAFEPEDGSIEVWWKGSPLFVHLDGELIQANGYDIAHLLSPQDRAAVLCAAEEKAREQAAAHAERVAYDAFAERAA